MRRSLRRGSLLATLLAALVACAGSPTAPASYDGNVFRDPQRGVEATLPAGWVFVAPDQFPSVMDNGADVLVQNDPAMSAAVAEATTRMNVVFIMVNAAQQDDAETIALATERMSDAHLGLTAETYALALANGLRDVGYWVSDPTAEPAVTISGNPYRSLRAHYDIENVTLYQTYYVRIIERELLYFVVTHRRQERSGELLEIVRTLRVE